MASPSPLKVEAMREINESLNLCTDRMGKIGISLNKPQSKMEYILRHRLMISLTFFIIFFHLFTDVAHLVDLMSNKSPGVQDIVPCFHIFGFGILSGAKVFALWYKKDVFGHLLHELADIWPMPPLNEEAAGIKEKSLSSLRTAHRIYYNINVYGVLFYYIAPIVDYCYDLYWLKNSDAQIGFIFQCWYPFDKQKTFNHILVYLFEITVGHICVCTCLASDLLFTGMMSHICMLLKILQQRLASITFTSSPEHNYKELIECIKLHQRLAVYCKEVDVAFSVANLLQIGFSSINICCVLFVIAFLEPPMALSNKMFLMSAFFEIGVICFYADDIIHSNAEVAMAAYKSGWHKSDIRCRKALIFIIQRSQKQIAMTAMNFANLDLNTYSAILTRSYSYFTLLCSMYGD